jgi:shikimate 5-dehydrogenase
MNEKNTITTQTKLYGFIAEYAQQNRFSVVLNRLFKESSLNMMMIPMNIREDDFYFTVSNMKKSHVNGAMISDEYRDTLIELLDEKDDFVNRSGFCDFTMVKDEKLTPLIITPKAIKKRLEALHVKKIAIIGSTPLSAALALELDEFECAFYDTYIEDLMSMSQRVRVDIDINRLAEDMSLDLSGYDIVIDACEMEDFSMLVKLPRYVLSLHVNRDSNLKELSQKLDSKYIDYDMMLEDLAQTTFRLIKEYNNE